MTTDYLTRVSYLSNGSQRIFAIPFAYLLESDIRFYDNGAGLPATRFTFLTPTSVQIDTALTAGHTLLIKRYTGGDELRAVIQTGTIDPDDINTVSNQLLYLYQELSDEALDNAATLAELEETVAGLEAGLPSDAIAFATLAAMVTASAAFETDTHEGVVVSLKGYNSAGDGAGGLVILTEDPSEAANGVTCYALSGDWCAERVIKEPVNLAWAGAKSGARELTGISTTATSTTVEADDATFSADDVGKALYIWAAGDTYDSLFGEIDSYVSPTEVTLVNPADRTVSSAPAFMGWPAREDLQTAINVVADSEIYHSAVLSGAYLLEPGAEGTSDNSVSPLTFGAFLCLPGVGKTYDFRNALILGSVIGGDFRDMQSVPTIKFYGGTVSALGDSRDGTVDGGAVSYNTIALALGKHCYMSGTAKGRTGVRLVSLQTNKYWGATPYLNLENCTVDVVCISDPDRQANDGIDISWATTPVGGSADNLVNGLIIRAEVHDCARPFYITGTLAAYNIRADVKISGDAAPLADDTAIGVQYIKQSTLEFNGTGVVSGSGTGAALTIKQCDHTVTVRGNLKAGTTPGATGLKLEEGTSGDTTCTVDLTLDGAFTTGVSTQAKGARLSVDIKGATTGIASGGFPTVWDNVVLRECGTPYAAGVATQAGSRFLKDWTLVDSSENSTKDATIGHKVRGRRVGTFVCNETTPVVVADTAMAVTDRVTISLNTVGGTVGALPSVKTITADTGFTVAGSASDTSTYNYEVNPTGV